MRFAVPFITTKIPLGYRMMIVSLIKESLKKADNVYYKKLYETDKNEMKPFASAAYLKNFQIDENIINLDEMTIIFSSPDQEFILHLYNGLLQTEFFKYQDFIMRRGKIKIIPEKTINSDSVIFRTLSPILIEDKQGKPLAPGEPEYAANINYYADLILKAYRQKGLQRELKVTPSRMKKQIIKESNYDFEKNNKSGQWLYFTSYKGFLKLEGTPEDLRLLYQLGLSKRRGQGFGLLEVIREGV